LPERRFEQEQRHLQQEEAGHDQAPAEADRGPGEVLMQHGAAHEGGEHRQHRLFPQRQRPVERREQPVAHHAVPAPAPELCQ
jgi:hypothetical protein